MSVSPSMKQLLDAVADAGAPLSAEAVADIDSRYPFFTLADAMLLQRAGASLTAAERERLSARMVLNAADPDSLMLLTDRSHADWRDFYPADETPTPSTDDTITSFLDRYGNSDPAQEALLERMIFNPVPDDYMSLLEMEGKDTGTGSEADGIPTLPPQAEPVAAQPAAQPTVEPPATPGPSIPVPPPYRPRRAAVPPEIPAQPADDSLLSESLAKIYIKQRRYDKAYEIIHSLSLNFPEKSIYFADQLRFLRKLIINQQNKDKKL